MKRFALVALVCALPAFANNKTQWKPEFVRIYADAQSQSYGMAKNRVSLASDVYSFGKGRTLPIQGYEGYLTAVTASARVKASLDGLLAQQRSININGRELLRVSQDDHGAPLLHTMYVYRELERGIYIGFTLEKPSPGILQLIDNTYKDDPFMGEVVKKHYQNNYVVRIILADNFHTQQDPPSMTDIMFAATLVGERDQSLRGIHDGNDYLAPLAEYYRKHVEYDILRDRFNPQPRSGQA